MTLHENDTNHRKNKRFSVCLSVSGLGKGQVQISNIRLSQAANSIIISIRGVQILGGDAASDNLVRRTVIWRWMGY